MKQEVQELIASMLADLDKGVPVEEIIASKMKEMQLSGESQAKVKESVEFVEKIDSASERLGEAVKRGTSREEWLSDYMDKLIERLPEEMQADAETLVSEITVQATNNINKEERL